MCLVVTGLSAQKTISSAARNELQHVENELAGMMEHIRNSDSVFVRNRINQLMQQKFIEALSLEDAMEYPFEKLDVLADVRSSSGDLRLFTWELADISGEVFYYGCLLIRKEGESMVFELIDKQVGYEIPENKSYHATNWYGAMYYDIIEIDRKGEKYYLLLGINRDELLIEKKIIEPLFFSNEPFFGKEVFEYPGGERPKRKVYQYSSESTMSIEFYPDDNRIVMDHLMPKKPGFEGRYEYYVTDLSFDALELKKGIWQYVPDYDAQIDKNLKDRYYEMGLPEQKKMY